MADWSTGQNVWSPGYGYQNARASIGSPGQGPRAGDLSSGGPGGSNMSGGGSYGSGGGETSVQGVMDEVANENDPNRQRTNTYYNPGASETDNTSKGLASFNESVGLASGYRSPGYAVDKRSGYVGGDYNQSAGWIGYAGMRANEARAGGNQFENAYNTGINQNYGSRVEQAQGLGMTADAANMYRQMALGQGPSLAQGQLQQGLQQSQAQQASIAAGARGGGSNLAAAQLAGATMAGQQSAVATQQAAQLRQQEQLAAMQGYGGLAGQYGGLASQMRGQDLSGAGLGMQGYQYQQGLAQNYEDMRQRQQLAELQAQAGLEQTQGQLAIQRQGQVGQQNQESAKSGIPILGGLLAGLSDEQMKTDIKDASQEIDSRIDKLRALEWRYKDEPKGTKRIGPMAQDMPPETVMEVGGVKVVRMPEATGFALAGLARLNERLRKLENKR